VNEGVCLDKKGELCGRLLAGRLSAGTRVVQWRSLARAEREVQVRLLETELEREGRMCQFLKSQGKGEPPYGPSRNRRNAKESRVDVIEKCAKDVRRTLMKLTGKETPCMCAILKPT
jgi:hypothetical protein